MMQHLLTKLAAAVIVVGAAIGADQAQAGSLPNLKNGLASETTPVEKAGYYRYRYGGYYPYRHWRPYPYYRPYYGYGYRPYWRYGYWNRPYYRGWW
jgi:hypothetical protein